MGKPMAVALPMEALGRFCRRWKVAELAVFGSILREDFGPASDVDFLITFCPDSRRSLFDLVDMKTELGTLLDRPVDLVLRQGIERSRNYLRRRAILDSAQVIYVAA